MNNYLNLQTRNHKILHKQIARNYVNVDTLYHKNIIALNFEYNQFFPFLYETEARFSYLIMFESDLMLFPHTGCGHNNYYSFHECSILTTKL